MESVQTMVEGGWQQIVAEKRKERDRAIASFSDFSEFYEKLAKDHERGTHENITDVDDTLTLANLIAKGDITSEDVARLYIARLTEILFTDALSRAKELDRIFVKTGKPIGPLHGVPMTLKDQFDVEGSDTTLGYVGRAHKPALRSAILVQILRRLGAVIIAKTNLPQSIMWCETENPLWGLTTNPMNAKYTPGGSTGGESALLYMHGSMVGWGTDIGGSIRIPSHMMGLYGLKPSSSRLPYFGVPVSTEGQEHVPSTVGPLARSLSSICHVTREMILDQPWAQDCRCAPIPWRSDVYEDVLSRKLTIGVLVDDNVVRPHPAITRVVEAAAAALSADGHEIIQWNAELHAECVEVMDLFYTADGGHDIRRDIEAGGEPFIPHVEKLVSRGEAISVYEYWQLNKRKKMLQQAYLGKWNNLKSPTTGKPVDALLMPVMPHPAVPHTGCRWVGYTKVWNFLDYTALAIPGGKVEEQDCQVAWDYAARNETDAWNSKIWVDNKHDMAAMDLPIGVQIIGRNLEEEKVLAIGKVLDNLINR
ncbi:hypothetical protein G7046_g398 [Stylonectria norvegica]|nr:hypothetical protein G7046_g398 [Stylonectria norvegica]